MLFLPLLLYCCTTGVQSQDQLYQLNDDGYIECYEDLDCPLPIELPEENSFMQFTCTGLCFTYFPAHFFRDTHYIYFKFIFRDSDFYADCFG